MNTRLVESYEPVKTTAGELALTYLRRIAVVFGADCLEDSTQQVRLYTEKLGGGQTTIRADNLLAKTGDFNKVLLNGRFPEETDAKFVLGRMLMVMNEFYNDYTRVHGPTVAGETNASYEAKTLTKEMLEFDPTRQAFKTLEFSTCIDLNGFTRHKICNVKVIDEHPIETELLVSFDKQFTLEVYRLLHDNS